MTGTTDIRIGCVQLAWSPSHRDRSGHLLRAALDDAATRQPDLLVLPELCLSGSTLTAHEARDLAEPVDGPIVTELARWSRRQNCVLVAGWAERHPRGSAPYNSAVVIDAGHVLGVYRKTHLWGIEKELFSPGDEAPRVHRTSIGRVAALICYDLEIPELVRTVAVEGAQLIAAPANWPLLPRPTDQWPIEIAKACAAAAINGVHIAVADRCGTDRGESWTGGSVIVGVDGYRTAGPALGRPGIIHAEADPARADDKSLGRHNDRFTDLRPELYRPPGPIDTGNPSAGPTD